MVTFIDAAVHQSFFVLTEQFLTSEEVGVPAKLGFASDEDRPARRDHHDDLPWLCAEATWLALDDDPGRTRPCGTLCRLRVLSGQDGSDLINVVHGICYAFFFATLYIFIDEYFPKDARASAQGLFNLLILGIGPFAANFACTRLADQYALSRNKDGAPVTLDYTQVFLFPWERPGRRGPVDCVVPSTKERSGKCEIKLIGLRHGVRAGESSEPESERGYLAMPRWLSDSDDSPQLPLNMDHASFYSFFSAFLLPAPLSAQRGRV